MLHEKLYLIIRKVQRKSSGYKKAEWMIFIEMPWGISDSYIIVVNLKTQISVSFIVFGEWAEQVKWIV